MNTKMNGRPIAYIDLNPIWTQAGNPERIESDGTCTLHLSATHHGDHDEFWVVEQRDGREYRRFNSRGIQCIRWLTDNGGGE